MRFEVQGGMFLGMFLVIPATLRVALGATVPPGHIASSPNGTARR